MDRRIRWGRILLAAFLLEVAITAVALPAGMFMGNPMQPPTDGSAVDATGYYVVVAVACAVLGFLFGMWGAAKASSRFGLHGLLVGITAMFMYFGLCSLAPGGLAGVIAAYGAAMYVLFNVLRTLGCWAGGGVSGHAPPGLAGPSRCVANRGASSAPIHSRGCTACRSIAGRAGGRPACPACLRQAQRR